MFFRQLRAIDVQPGHKVSAFTGIFLESPLMVVERHQSNDLPNWLVFRLEDGATYYSPAHCLVNVTN